jgi:hypothetical protein
MTPDAEPALPPRDARANNIGKSFSQPYWTSRLFQSSKQFAMTNGLISKAVALIYE